LRQNILLSTLFSDTLSLRPFFKCERPGSTPLRNSGQNYSSVYLTLYIFG
jgi:hypothetical protein